MLTLVFPYILGTRLIFFWQILFDYHKKSSQLLRCSLFVRVLAHVFGALHDFYASFINQDINTSLGCSPKVRFKYSF